MRTKRCVAPVGFKAVNLAAGTFEAVVSVFGNVDYVGDRVVAGAFVGSLDRWKTSGDPIPCIWSHAWDDPFAHIGYVVEAAERFGGLWVKAKCDLDNPTAAEVMRLLAERRVKEFSFAYDVIDEREASGGVTELVELDIIEVGPTLKGANSETELLSATKSRAMSPRAVLRSLDAMAAEGRRRKSAMTVGSFRRVEEAIAYGDPAAVRAALSLLEA